LSIVHLPYAIDFKFKWKMEPGKWKIKMLSNIKSILYFPLASYFRFFAAIRLRRWDPHIIVVTGSSGKTTLLHLLESQFGQNAKYSHHANSSYGIPFDILNLHRKSLKLSEWVELVLKSPMQAFKEPYKEPFYIVEADTDRPGEGKFLAEFLKPEVTLWVSVSRTHGMNFDRLVNDNEFNSVEEAIAYDFGFFLQYCSKYAMINGDLPLQVKQVDRTKAKVKEVKEGKDIDEYKVEKHGTTFMIKGKRYSFDALLPKEVFYSIVMCREAVEYFDLPFDRSFTDFLLPPGRGTVLQGIQQTVIVDSSYNANLASMEAMLSMFAKFPVEKKWVVLGDMLELGEKEQEEHERLGEILAKMDLERVVLVGRRVGKYTLPKLESIKGIKSIKSIKGFENQSDALHYLQEQIMGGEAILFKGSQSLFLEGIIEPLLKDQKEASRLPRRGKFWEEKREKIYG
jgi:UDP-N-acetylmuramyl pentapeptide synthase